MLFVGIGLISLNNFNSIQKIEGTKDELISNLKLARNYATTMQLPEGVDPRSNELSYVQVDISSNGQMTATAESVGSTFYTKDISPSGIVISILPPATTIQFSSYKGASINGDVNIIIGSTLGVGDTRVININASGLIDEI